VSMKTHRCLSVRELKVRNYDVGDAITSISADDTLAVRSRSSRDGSWDEDDSSDGQF